MVHQYQNPIKYLLGLILRSKYAIKLRQVLKCQGQQKLRTSINQERLNQRGRSYGSPTIPLAANRLSFNSILKYQDIHQGQNER